MKTVKQFIEELQKLDQDKPIWTPIWIYDSYYAFEPEVKIPGSKDYTYDENEIINKDDYVILH